MKTNRKGQRILWIAAIVGFFAFALPASAAEIYVDASAADGGDGTEASPYNTLNRALLDIIPGEANTIHATGVFHEYVKVGPEYGGTSEETRTTLQRWDGRDQPVNDARGTAIPGDIFDLTGAYITLRGFEVIGANQAANIWSGDGAHHVIVEDNFSHGAYGNNSKGVCYRNSRDGIIRNNITTNNDYVGIYVPGQGSVNVEVYNNISYENGRYGIRGVEGSDNLYIHHNTVYNNGYIDDSPDISGISYTSSQPALASGVVIEENIVENEKIGIHVERGNDLRISNNRIVTGERSGVNIRNSEFVTVENNTIEGFAFSGINIESSHDLQIEKNVLRENSVNVRSFSNVGVLLTRNELLDNAQTNVSMNGGTRVALENNILAGNGGTAIWMMNVEQSRILHNTIVNHTYGISFSSPGQPSFHARVFNNLFHNLKTVYIYKESNTDGIRLGNNAYSSVVNYASVQSMPRTRMNFCWAEGKDCTSLEIQDPRFVDEAAGDFHLQWNSSLIGKGDPTHATLVDIDGDDRLSDGTVDIGADEAQRLGLPRSNFAI